MHTRPSLLWSSSSKAKFTSDECTGRPHFCVAIQATVQHPHLENWNSDHVSSQYIHVWSYVNCIYKCGERVSWESRHAFPILKMCWPDAALSATPRKKTYAALYTAVTLLTLNGKISDAVKHGGVWTSAWDLAEEIIQVWWCTLIAIFNGWLTSTVNGASSLSMNLCHESSIISGIICPSASRKSYHDVVEKVCMTEKAEQSKARHIACACMDTDLNKLLATQASNLQILDHCRTVQLQRHPWF